MGGHRARGYTPCDKIIMLASRALVAQASLRVQCRLPSRAIRLWCMSLHRPVSKRYLGNQQLMYPHMMCLGQLHNRFRQPMQRRNILRLLLMLLLPLMLLLLLLLLQS